LSAANWDEDTCTITLDDEHYNNHIKVWLLSTACCPHIIVFGCFLVS
jgi:hypothetical protein